MTAACAIVNDSIAPKAYMLARKSAWPGSSVRQAMTPKTRIPIHGVLNFGCSRRRRITARCAIVNDSIAPKA